MSFYDPKTTNWISVAGTAKLNSNRDAIKKVWHSGVGVWFGDLGDGVHKGDENDPRVSLIEVIPEEVSWLVEVENMLRWADDFCALTDSILVFDKDQSGPDFGSCFECGHWPCCFPWRAPYHHKAGNRARRGLEHLLSPRLLYR